MIQSVLIDVPLKSLEKILKLSQTMLFQRCLAESLKYTHLIVLFQILRYNRNFIVSIT